MEDKAIVDLYWQRSERAIAETDTKYGGYCYSVAYNVLANREDAEESVNDTYLATWNALPPQRPNALTAFLGRLARNISIDRWRILSADKRGGGQMVLALEELGECVSGGDTVEEVAIGREAVAAFNRFLDALPKTERTVFLRRYWYLDSIGDIGEHFGFSNGKVSTMLHRTRTKLKAQLQKEGYV